MKIMIKKLGRTRSDEEVKLAISSKNAQEHPRTLDIVYLLGKIVLLPALTSLAEKTANPISTKKPPFGGFFVWKALTS